MRVSASVTTKVPGDNSAPMQRRYLEITITGDRTEKTEGFVPEQGGVSYRFFKNSEKRELGVSAVVESLLVKKVGGVLPLGFAC